MPDDDLPDTDSTSFIDVNLPSIDSPDHRESLRWRRRMWRASITESALLTAEEVAELIPGRVQVNRRWLDHVPRLRLPSGQEVFRWGEVLRHLERVA